MDGHRARAVSARLAVVLGLAVLAPRTPVTGAQVGEPIRVTPLDAQGRIPYFIADGEAGSRYRPGDGDLAAWALQEWERSAGGAVRFERVGQEEAALIRVHWLPYAEDAALGRMESSIVDGRLIATINVRPDEGHFRPSIRRRVEEDPLMRDTVLYFVSLHEIGHALGLSHSHNPRDVMWPGSNGVTLPIYDRYRHRLMSRDDLAHASWLSPDDLARFRAVWTGPTQVAVAPVRPGP